MVWLKRVADIVWRQKTASRWEAKDLDGYKLTVGRSPQATHWTWRIRDPGGGYDLFQGTSETASEAREAATSRHGVFIAELNVRAWSPVSTRARREPLRQSLGETEVVTWWGPRTERRVASPAELHVALDECESGPPRGRRLARIIRASGDKMILGVGADAVPVCAIFPARSPPYATSMDNSYADEETTFDDAGSTRGIAFKYCVDGAAARVAASLFLDTGALTGDISFEPILLTVDWLLDE
jgi:hypothetical protein